MIINWLKNLEQPQGNRISKLSQHPSQKAIAPCGPPELFLQRAFGGFGTDQVERHVPQDGEVVRAVVHAVPRLIFVHGDVETPVQAILDGPMRTDDLTEPPGDERLAEQIVGAFGGRLIGGLADTDNLADRSQTWPAMVLLQP